MGPTPTVKTLGDALYSLEDGFVGVAVDVHTDSVLWAEDGSQEALELLHIFVHDNGERQWERVLLRTRTPSHVSPRLKKQFAFGAVVVASVSEPIGYIKAV